MARIVADRSWPRMYSIEMKYSPSTAPSSKIWTMFGWLRRADSFASSTNILMKVGSSERCGRMRLTTKTRSKPAGPWIRPLYTSAMPPRPMRSKREYLPNWIGWGSGAANAGAFFRRLRTLRNPNGPPLLGEHSYPRRPHHDLDSCCGVYDTDVMDLS